MAASDLDARFFASQREPSALGQQALTTPDRLGEIFARTPPTFFRAGFVDFVGALGGIGQDQDFVARDLEESTADRHRALCASAFDAHNPWLEGREQGRVARQNADDALSTWRDDHVDVVFGVHLALGGDNLDVQRHD